MRPRHAKSAQAIAGSTKDVCSPVPPGRDVPDRKTDVADDVDACSEKYGRPSGALADAVRGPCVHQCGEDLDAVSCGGVDVDLPDGIFGRLGSFEVLGEDWL